MVELICPRCSRRVGQVVGTPSTPELRLWHNRTRGIRTVPTGEPAEVFVTPMTNPVGTAMPPTFRVRVKTGCAQHGDSTFTSGEVWQAISRYSNHRGYRPVRLVGKVVAAGESRFEVDWFFAVENPRFEVKTSPLRRRVGSIVPDSKRNRILARWGVNPHSPADRRRSSSV